MKQEEALKLCNALLTGLQRARSIVEENASRELSINGNPIDPKVMDSALEDITPWLFGEKGNALVRGLGIVSDRDSVKGMEFFNFMYIIHVLEPTLNMMAGALTDTMFPEPDIAWAGGLK